MGNEACPGATQGNQIKAREKERIAWLQAVVGAQLALAVLPRADGYQRGRLDAACSP